LRHSCPDKLKIKREEYMYDPVLFQKFEVSNPTDFEASAIERMKYVFALIAVCEQAGLKEIFESVKDLKNLKLPANRQEKDVKLFESRVYKALSKAFNLQPDYLHNVARMETGPRFTMS
jgi:hypothetical protein